MKGNTRVSSQVMFSCLDLISGEYLLPAGPSYTLGTACSSTLYAFANAMQSMKHGECDASIVGGVALNILPDLAEYFTKLGMTSPDGKCKHFDNDGKFHHLL